MSDTKAIRRIAQAHAEKARALNLAKCRLTELPEAIGTLELIDDLDLSRNHLSTLPEAIGNLTSLSSLSLQGNALKQLPKSMAGLHHLKRLYLGGNNLRELPAWIGNLSQLQELDIGWNDLQTLPDTLLNLKNLKMLFLHGNPKLGLPPEVLGPPRLEGGVAWRPADARIKGPVDAWDILDFYFRSHQRRRLNEAKVILVGQGGVGKTSLVKRLLNDSFDDREQKTEGINISRWAVQAKHEGEMIRLNVWDFGGQEIMHSTHQFFLTKRSIYMLVMDSRAGEREGNIHYWLEMIRMYGEGSPLLIVMNKCEQHYEKLDENRIRLDYEGKINLVGFHYVSCKTGEGVTALGGEIKSQVRDLPHVSDLLPNDYFEVKQELEARAVNTDFITEEEYVDLCSSRGVIRDKDRMRLLRFLHDLGCILHYDDPDQLYQIRDTKVLNPEWVTGGVYRVLNDPTLLREATGIVARSDLRRLLHADADGRSRYPEHRHPFLIDMMRKYELGFDFPDDVGKLLVPELLSKNEPDVGWRKPGERHDDTLNFAYHYPVLPRGLIPRFIVRSHHLLTDQPTCWRAGVVLEVEECRVLVRGDTLTARVYIEVQGAADKRRRALAIIRDYFDAIHPTYGDLRAEAKVPLPDDPQAPPVDYEYLLALEKDGVNEQRFEKTRRKYNIRELLEGIDERSFDLFLSHYSGDKPLVRELHKLLQQHGIRCWLDEVNLTPGMLWQEEIVRAMRDCRCIGVLLGPKAVGDWQLMESQLGIEAATRSRKRIIPVLLPGVSIDLDELPASFEFLKLRTWVDMSQGYDEYQIARLADAVKKAAREGLHDRKKG